VTGKQPGKELHGAQASRGQGQGQGQGQVSAAGKEGRRMCAPRDREAMWFPGWEPSVWHRPRFPPPYRLQSRPCQPYPEAACPSCGLFS
jgi:hypothetical protein